MVTLPWYVYVVAAVGVGMGLAPIAASVMLAIHARTKITRMKRIIDRLVWPMTQQEFTEMQYVWAAFTHKIYADSGNFMSHRETATVSPAFKKKLEKRLGISV